MKQTVLGSGGAIGKALAKELSAFTNDIRLVSRNPFKVNAEDELFAESLIVRESVFRAVT